MHHAGGHTSKADPPLLQMISLSPIEMCSVVEHARTTAVGGGNKLSIYHDPGVGTPYAPCCQTPLQLCKAYVALRIHWWCRRAGQQTKALQGDRIAQGYALSLNVGGGAAKFYSSALAAA